MAKKFILKTLVSGIKKGNTFDPRYTDLDSVAYQDQFDPEGVKVRELNVGDEVKYGYRILAGEPCPSDQTQKRRIFFLQIEEETTGKVALTFRYLKQGETVLNLVVRKNKFDIEDPPDPPNSDDPPVIYPDPDSELPNYDEDNDDSSDQDDDSDPPSGEGNDCDGVIGISA